MHSSEILIIAAIFGGIAIVAILSMAAKHMQSSGGRRGHPRDGADDTSLNPAHDPSSYLFNNSNADDSTPPDESHHSHHHHHHHQLQPDSGISSDPGASHHGGFDSGSQHEGFDSGGHSSGGFDSGSGHH